MSHTRLSVNLNKIALIRNARGANYPDILKFAQLCESYGAEGITVHPRPDERHIRFSDLQPLKEVVTTEFNIEGYPSERFVKAVCEVRPHQVTLVPDSPDALTSDNGWDTNKHASLLTDVISTFQEQGIRVSLFLNPDVHMVEGAVRSGADRIELYTGEYAKNYPGKKWTEELMKHSETGKMAKSLGMGVNAGHDLNLHNLKPFLRELPYVDEVSIGHALTVDSLLFGLKNVILMYLNEIRG